MAVASLLPGEKGQFMPKIAKKWSSRGQVDPLCNVVLKNFYFIQKKVTVLFWKLNIWATININGVWPWPCSFRVKNAKMSKFTKFEKRYEAKLLHKTLTLIFSKSPSSIFLIFAFLESSRGVLWDVGCEIPWSTIFYYSP